MIVVDTNVLAYLYLPTEFTPQAERLLECQPDWVAPVLWRSELRNVLSLYLRQLLLTFEQAYAIQTEAEMLLADREYSIGSLEVLRLVEASECSAYGCEFVALAKRLGIALVTADRKVLQNFPGVAVSLSQAVH
ncbi:PIN domain-containing protein [Methylolobus aquaticus]|nr:PIN domain-containing protein [Methylolobus aquaticus]